MTCIDDKTPKKGGAPSLIGVALALLLFVALLAGGGQAATASRTVDRTFGTRALVPDRVLTLDNHRRKLIDLETNQERAIAPSIAFESATLSPDGTKIAANRVSGNGLLTVNVNTGSTKRITNGDDAAPTWSPDGKWLAFARGSGEAPLTHQGLYLVRSNGTGLHLVKSGIVSTPAWSPNGKLIAFDSWAVRGWDATNQQWLHTATSLAVISPSGRNVRRLTSHPWPPARQGVDDLDPMWSPSNSTIAFQRTSGAGDSGGSSVYVVKPNGSRLRRVTPAGYFAEPTGWSSDGAQLADWQSKICGGCASNGPMQAWITDVSSGSRSAVGSFASVIWSPSGKLVAFGCDAATSGVCVVDEDGTVVQTILSVRQ